MKWLWRLLFTIVLTLAIAVVGVFIAGRMSLPEYQGTVALRGLENTVRIVRDRFAVPHIRAQNRADSLFALGYVHAQDRLWQMEMQRRIGQGRLSEIAGQSTVSTDIFLRTLGVYRAAERTVEHLDAETRALLDAYVTGINAFLDNREGLLPPEFLITGIEPEPWRPADTLVWLKMMAWNLSGNWANEARRAALATRLSPEQLRDLWPDYPADGPTAIRNLAGAMPADFWSDLAKLDPFPQGPGTGSNNWVVSGSRSATGKPLLANDPHLGLQTPAIWYFAAMDDGTDATIGATLPGVPFVVLGRNRHIAWGFTNTSPDTQDLYIEQVNPDDPTQYRTEDGWAPFETVQEVIRVSGGDAVTITVRKTRHGPVMSDVTERLSGIAPEGHVVAFRWHVLDDDEFSIRAGLNTHPARNWRDFREAMRDFTGAQQNMVYADVAGNIGFIAAGKVPVRVDQSDWQGMLPVKGWEPEAVRVGYIPYDALPQTFNPAKGYVVTANNRIVGDGYPWFITNEWAAPYRAQRITDLLDARSIHSIESFKSIQADQVSLFVRQMKPLMTVIAPEREDLRTILADLKLWDGDMDADRTEPTIFVAWYLELVRQLIVDETGNQIDQVFGFRPTFVHNVLTDRNGASRWCDDVATDGVENCNVIIMRALDLAMAGLEMRHGIDRADWRWGDIHRAISPHNPFGRVDPLKQVFDVSVPVGGGSFTVNVAHGRPTSPEGPMTTGHAASLRALYNLDNLDASLYMHSTGQSGHLLSPHYDDFAERWRQVDYIPMSLRAEDIEPGAIGTMVMQPLR